MKSYLIVIAAPSGAGKTSLCTRLLHEFPILTLSISSTTRSPRGNEKNGVEYFFINKTEFEKKIQENRFAEWAEVHGNFYGTSKDVIEKCFRGKKSLLLDIDVQGASQLVKAFPKNCIRIFIMPPSLEVLEERLRTRGTDSEETIRKRLDNARREIQEGIKFEHIIVNDSFDDAYRELKSILEVKYQLPSLEKGSEG